MLTKQLSGGSSLKGAEQAAQSEALLLLALANEAPVAAEASPVKRGLEPEKNGRSAYVDDKIRSFVVSLRKVRSANKALRPKCGNNNPYGTVGTTKWAARTHVSARTRGASAPRFGIHPAVARGHRPTSSWYDSRLTVYLRRGSTPSARIRSAFNAACS